MQWKIYDAYIEEVQIQEKNKERQKAASSSKDGDKSVKKVLLMESQVRQENRSTVPPAALAVIVISFLFLQTNDISKVNRGAKILERMVNQNISDDIAHGMFQEIL